MENSVFINSTYLLPHISFTGIKHWSKPMVPEGSTGLF